MSRDDLERVDHGRMSRDAMDHDGMVYADSVVDLVGNTPW